MPSLLDSPPQLPAAGAWSSLYAVKEPLKPPRHVLVAPTAAAKKPAYGGRKNLETCTEALGCETGGVDDAAAEEVDDGAERKRRAREEEVAAEGRVCRAGRRGGGVLPPPLTTLARGASRVRMVHERRDGRLAVYAVPTPGMQAERSGGRLHLRLRLLPCGVGGNAACTECNHPESQEAEDEETEEAKQEVGEEEYDVAKYVRDGRCVGAEGGATAASRGKKWEPQQAAAFWVATT